MMEKNEIACEKMRRIEIAPSLLGCDFRRMEEEIRKAEKAGADRLHLDVMDGVFVPNISFGQVIVEWVRKVTSLYLDAHLMIEKPHRYFESFKRVGVDQITFHVEEYGIPLPPRYTYPKTVEKVDEEELEKRVKEVKELGLRVALAFNPGTPILAERIFPLLDEILIMTVNPGFGGQKLIPEALEKVKEVRKVFPGKIAVDGGVNQDTLKEVIEAGVDVLVMGTYFFQTPGIQEVIPFLKHGMLPQERR